MADTTTVMDRPASIDFSDSSVNHDHVFIVEGEKFHVLSPFLSMWSEHFRRMFEGDFAEANKKEIEIKEVEPELFKKYLLVVYMGFCELESTDLIPLIHLSYRFLTPHVLDFCKKIIDRRLNKLEDPVKVELLKTACIHVNKDIKNKLIDHFKNLQIIKDFKCEELFEVVVEYNLDDLKAWLGNNMNKNLTFANCSDLLDASLKFNMPTLKESISKQIEAWYTDYENYSSVSIPREFIIDLAKAAVKHDVEILKYKLQESIKYLCRRFVPNNTGQYYERFLDEHYDQIMKLPEDVKKFIILAAAAY